MTPREHAKAYLAKCITQAMRDWRNGEAERGVLTASESRRAEEQIQKVGQILLRKLAPSPTDYREISEARHVEHAQQVSRAKSVRIYSKKTLDTLDKIKQDWRGMILHNFKPPKQKRKKRK